MFSLFFKNIFNLLPINLGIDSNPLISGPVDSYRANHPDCIILDNCVYEDFILADEPFTKALRISQTCVIVNNNLHEKLVSSLEFPITFNERFKVTSVAFFIVDLNYLLY